MFAHSVHQGADLKERLQESVDICNSFLSCSRHKRREPRLYSSAHLLRKYFMPGNPGTLNMRGRFGDSRPVLGQEQGRHASNAQLDTYAHVVIHVVIIQRRFVLVGAEKVMTPSQIGMDCA